MNVIEIDGASNNSVDNIRDLIENVQYVPTSGQYKIYVIDEVHMLSTSAFNALLKTLEEPPAHVIFIFATTEPEKLIGTVLSRCQRFDFRHLSNEDLENHLKHISQVENIVFTHEKLLKQICVQGRGSVRDTLSLLDQVLSYTTDNQITEETIVIALGLARASTIKLLIDSLLKGDVEVLSKSFRGLLGENVSAKNILISLLDQFFEIIEHATEKDYLQKNDLVTPDLLTSVSTPELFWIYETLAKDATWVLATLTPDKVTEIVLQKLALRRNFFSIKTEEKISAESEPKKKLIPEETSTQAQAPQDPPLSPVVQNTKDWDGFVKHLSKKSQILILNIDQGNLLKPFNLENGKLKLDLAFDANGKFSYECLIERDQRERLIQCLEEFFEIEKSKIELNLILLTEDQKTEYNFFSRAEMENQKKEKRVHIKKENLLQHPNLQEAEKIFNAKIDKVIINNS
jgi:DNA polymerase-3 subunit gamma/tau